MLVANPLTAKDLETLPPNVVHHHVSRSSSSSRATKPEKPMAPVLRYVKHCLTPVPVLRQMNSFLRDISEALDQLGVRHWLDHGTLLGALRFASFLPWDDDVDIGVMDIDFSSSVEKRFKAIMNASGYYVGGYHNSFPPRRGKKGKPRLVQVFLRTSIERRNEERRRRGEGKGKDRTWSGGSVDYLHLDLWVYQYVMTNASSLNRSPAGYLTKSPRAGTVTNRPRAGVQSFGPRVQFASAWHASYTKTSASYRDRVGIPLPTLLVHKQQFRIQLMKNHRRSIIAWQLHPSTQ